MLGPYLPHEIKLLLADLTPLERARIWKIAFGRAQGSWQAWIGSLGGGVGAFLGITFAPTISRGLVGYHLRGIIVAVMAGFGAYLGGRVRAVAAMRHLRRELAAIGRCPSCGYDLRETPNRCPECGQIPEKQKGS